MTVNRPIFYQRFEPVYGKLNKAQISGYEAIFDFWDSRSVLVDERWLAYILATAFHETGRRMTAVRECFCKSDACSINCVTKMFKKGIIKKNYALPHPNGNSYFGRGHVQLTHGHNYQRVGKAIALGNQLYDNPSLALNLKVSVKILCVGMLAGLFVPGHNLERYFTKTKSDWKNARRIVNRLDKWEIIKKYAINMLSFIELDTPGGRVCESDADDVLKLYERLNARAGRKDNDEFIDEVGPDQGGENIFARADLPTPPATPDSYREILTDDDRKVVQDAVSEHPLFPDSYDEEDQECCCCCHE